MPAASQFSDRPVCNQTSDATVCAQLQFVTFAIGSETFAVDLLSVHEITPAPMSRSEVEGVLSLRGRNIPLLDLRMCPGMASGEHSDQSRIIVVEGRGGGRTLGLIVDRVHEVLSVESTAIEAAPATGSFSASAPIAGACKLHDRRFNLLDLKRLVEAQTLQAA
jgi:purine-binding chemotaxis protein CheW